MNGFFTKELEKIEQFIIRGKYNLALDEIDVIYNNEKSSTEERIKCKIFKARIYLTIFPYSEAIKYAEEAYCESIKTQNKLLMFDSILILPRAYFYKGEYETIREKTELLKEIIESFDNKNSEEYLKRKASISLIQSERFKIPFSILNESVSIAEKLGDPILKADSYFSIGSKHLWSGNLDEALKYAKNGLEICENIGYHHSTAMLLSLMGVIYIQKGELDLACDCVQKNYSMFKNDLSLYFEACMILNLAEIMWLKRNLDTSLAYYKEAIPLLKKSKVVSTNHYPWTLLKMNDILIEMERYEEVSENIQKIEQLYLSKKEYIMKKILFLAKAKFLKIKSDQKNIEEAINLLEEIADDKTIVLVHYSSIVFLLCDLYILKITKFNDIESYEKLKQRVNSLKTIAEHQKSHILFALSLLIKSKLELINFNVSLGQTLLEEAQKIADEKGITYLAKVISNEYDILLTQLSTWREMSSYFPSLEERFQITHLEELLTKIIKNNAVYINFQEEKELPYFFLIINKDRNILFSESFGDFSLNDELLQGILSCINENISSQSLENNNIKRIMYQNYTIAIDKQKNLLLVYSFVGESYPAMQKLRSFSKEFSLLLDKWNRYFEQFKTNKKLTLDERMGISRFLETVFFTD
jgi:tetratricopeptide (TPR) repeat protein